MSRKKPIKVAVCGFGADNLPERLLLEARKVGRFLAEEKAVVFTGATTGYSYQAAKSAQKNGGLTIGISPAASEPEHQHDYYLPIDVYQIIVFTGLGYKVRDIVMVRSVDAVIFIGGGTGTMTEFCAAVDYQKIIGVLQNSGGVTQLFPEMINHSHRFQPKMILESQSELLVKKIIQAVKSK